MTRYQLDDEGNAVLYNPVEVTAPAHLIGEARALQAISDERRRQDAKFPGQSLLNGTGPHGLPRPVAEVYESLLDQARDDNDIGDATWESVLLEEFCEAMLESNPVRLRAELVQVAAVAVRWIEDLDR